MMQRPAYRFGNGLTALHFHSFRSGWLTWAMIVAGAILWMVLPTAQAQNLPTDTSGWLARIQSAAQRENYSGTFVYQQGTQFQSSRITHLYESGSEYEKLEVLDGQPREIIRRDDEVRCYVPDSKTLMIEQRSKSDSFPSLLTAPDTDLNAHYRIEVEGIRRIAGRTCHILLMVPRDGKRYGYRLWADQETGLLLKAQTLNEKREVIEQAAFTEVTIGQPIEKSRVRPTVRSTEGWQIEKLSAPVADLETAGWKISMPVPGFRKIREVMRSFGGSRQVGQVVYSDGLASISIFVEEAASAGQVANAAGNETSRGTINIVTRRHGDHWLTVVGEVPVAVVRQVANSIEFKATLK